jgi:hypothetical protein
MTDSTGSLDVNGDLLLGGGDTEGSLTDGVLHISGELWTVSVSFKTFNPSGNHTVIFDGTAEQTIYLQFPGEKTHRFQNMIVDNPVGVIFNSEVPILGDATILQGYVRSSGHAISLHGSLTDSAGGNWQPTSTVVSSGAPSLPQGMVTDLSFDTLTVLQSDFSVTGNVTVTGKDGNLDLNGKNVTVTGNFATDGDGLLTMQDGAGDLTVSGNASFDGASTDGLLTAGRFSVGGNFTWVGNNEAYYFPSGSHQTLFGGSTPQSILLTAGGGRVYHVQDLYINASADVTMTEDITVQGDLVIDGTFHLDPGTTLTILGTLTVNPGGTLDDAAGTVIGG